MVSNNHEQPSHSSPRDCTRAGTIVFDDEYIYHGGKIARLGECTQCERKFERVWLHSHDQCYSPEHEQVSISPRPH